MTGEHWETTGGDVVDVWRGDGQVAWYWHVKAPNGEIVEQGEAYFNRSDAIDAAERHHPRIGTPDD